MNQWWFLAFILWSLACGLAGWKSEEWRLDSKEQSAIIEAQTNVIQTVQKQDGLINNTEVDYEKDVANDIDPLYPDSVPESAASNLPANPCPPARTGTYSKRFHLSPKQCDIEEDKLIRVWDLHKKLRQTAQ